VKLLDHERKNPDPARTDWPAGTGLDPHAAAARLGAGTVPS